MIKKLILKLLMKRMNTDSSISRDTAEEIATILKDNKKLKKHANFLFVVIEYNIRKKENTEVQLKALRRINA